MFGYLQNAAVHGEIVLTRGDDQVRPPDQTLLINLVVMEQRSTRSFGRAHALQSVGLTFGANVFGENLRIVRQLLQPLDAVKNFDQARLVVVEGAEDCCALQFFELREFLVGTLSATAVSNVEPRQGTYAVHAIRISFG